MVRDGKQHVSSSEGTLPERMRDYFCELIFSRAESKQVQADMS